MSEALKKKKDRDSARVQKHHQDMVKEITSDKNLKKKSKDQIVPKKLTSTEALKKKYKERDLKNRQKVNKLVTEVNSLTSQLERWSEDNSTLQQHNLDLMETVKTINTVIRGLMFNKCSNCKTVWKMSLIKKMMKNLIIDCPGCDLWVQVK